MRLLPREKAITKNSVPTDSQNRLGPLMRNNMIDGAFTSKEDGINPFKCLL